MRRRSILKFASTFPLMYPIFALRGQVAPPPKADTQRLLPTPDETTGLPLLKLPPNFSYRSFGWTGEKMTIGGLTPQRHDGMAVLPGKTADELVLLRNHEDYEGEAIRNANTELYYDRGVAARTNPESIDVPSGGVTALTIKDGKVIESAGVLTGTMVNCAGGPTPWGSWLSCEEVVYRRSLEQPLGDTQLQDHGYVFETLPLHLGHSSHLPIKDMGLMRHEAAAVDPATGNVYLTEDSSGASGFYKFEPNDNSMKVGSLEKGGKLSMLRVGKLSVSLNLTQGKFGSEYSVTWVPIAEPDADPEQLSPTFEGGPNTIGSGMSGPFRQGKEQGGTTFSRLEGCWYHAGIIYFVDTAGGPNGHGSVWAYDPANEKLSNCFAATTEGVADAIDNITINPVNGTIVLCEDGGGIYNQDQFISGSRLLLVGEDNTALPVAENNINLSKAIPGHEGIAVADHRSSEWAGATFAPDGKTLYANIQTPGVTFAIEGPWLG